jgi:hypothetical protein
MQDNLNPLIKRVSLVGASQLPYQDRCDIQLISRLRTAPLIMPESGKLAGKTAMHVILWPKFLQFAKILKFSIYSILKSILATPMIFYLYQLGLFVVLRT